MKKSPVAACHSHSSSLMRSIEDLVSFGSGKNFRKSAINDVKKNGKILFVSDEKIWKNCGKFFDEKSEKILLLKNPKADEKNLKKIESAIKNSDFILALGSGTINDLCKFTSAQKNIPYAVFASAASMNGYLSKNASITINGHKKTLPATLPQKVFCDLEILKAAPADLTKAGLGDSLCFYSCWFDWYLSHKILGTKFDKKPFEMLQKKMDFLIKNYPKFSLKDEKFLKLLIEILLLSGLGMTGAGGSYPASQSEHLIAHAIDMKYPKISAKNLHGQMIAVTTLSTAYFQSVILDARRRGSQELDVKLTRSSALQAKDDELLRKFFGKKAAAECKKEYEAKISQFKKAKNLSASDKKELAKIHLAEKQLKEIFKHFKIKTSPKSLGLSDQQYQACVAHAKFIRNRFTCLDLI